MPSVLDNLITAKANIAAKIAEISANPKPNYSIDGQSISWASYFDMLNSQLGKLDESIAVAQGPFEMPIEFRP